MSALLSPKRFWYRVNLIKRAAANVYRHPLFQDMQALSNPMRITRGQTAAHAWRSALTGEEVPPLPELDPEALVFTHIGSSMGNVRSLPLMIIILLLTAHRWTQ